MFDTLHHEKVEDRQVQRFIFSVVAVLAIAGTSDAQSVIFFDNEAARAAVIGASLEQGRQFAQDQRAARDRAAMAQQEAAFARQAAIEAEKAAGAAAWANMNAEARAKSIQAVARGKARHAKRAETIKKVQDKRKATIRSQPDEPVQTEGKAKK